MDVLADPLPRQWRVTLKDGTVIRLWAGSYGESDGHYTFEVMAEAPVDQQADEDLVISAMTASKPERFMFVVARIPFDAVRDIETGHWGGTG